MGGEIKGETLKFSTAETGSFLQPSVLLTLNPLQFNNANFGHICPKFVNLHSFVDIQ